MKAIEEIWTALDQLRAERNRRAHGIEKGAASGSVHEEIASNLLLHLRDTLADTADPYQPWLCDEHISPRNIVEFCAKIIERLKPKTILDPMCGYGVLLAAASEADGAEIIHGVDINRDASRVASVMLDNRAIIINDNIFAKPEGLLDRYDLIVADPPLNYRVREEQLAAFAPSAMSSDLASNLIVWASSRLSAKGKAIFVLPPSFFVGTGRKQIQKSISANGCRMAAAIYVPGGTRSNTSIPTYLVVLERGEQSDVFIGRLSSDSINQNYLLANLFRRQPRGEASLGRLCPLEQFNGFERFVANENLLRLVRDFGWTAHNAENVFPGYALLRSRSQSDHLESDAESLFIKLVGKGTASTQIDDLGSSLNEVLHLKVNTMLAEPSFLVHWFNDSRIGRLSLEALRDGATIPRIRVKDLLGSVLYLPSIHEQRLVIEGSAYLRKIRADADELESALVLRTEPVEDVVQRIRRINQEDLYEDWLETLPFPLASILWRHHASQDSYRHRYEVLLHFFEATAAFLATIHLSAFMSDLTLWDEAGKSLNNKLLEQNLSLKRATFGAWKLAAERLGSDCSAILKQSERSSEKEEIWQRIYCTPDRRIVEMICSSSLLGILQRANKIRNDWQGHSGAISEETAKGVHSQLFDLVQQLRGIFGGNWKRYELIQPDSSRFRGGLHYITCKRLMGTRSAPFEERIYESKHPLETETLYLFDPLSQTGLQLRPFIEVIPSPERRAVACFIFNRLEKESARWISYHFEQESEISHASQGVNEALEMLNRFKDPGG
jgi:hypothetical protein